MDKEILAVIGQLYLENISLRNLVEALKNKVSELDQQKTVTKSSHQQSED